MPAQHYVTFLGCAVGALALITVTVATWSAATDSPYSGGGEIRIGILNDQSGTYADLAGAGSVEAAKMAVEEFRGNVNGVKVEIVAVDHQNKPDVGASIARAWIDRDGVDAIADFSNSAVGLAVQALAAERRKISWSPPPPLSSLVRAARPIRVSGSTTATPTATGSPNC